MPVLLFCFFPLFPSLSLYDQWSVFFCFSSFTVRRCGSYRFQIIITFKYSCLIEYWPNALAFFLFPGSHINIPAAAGGCIFSIPFDIFNEIYCIENYIAIWIFCFLWQQIYKFCYSGRKNSLKKNKKT